MCFLGGSLAIDVMMLVGRPVVPGITGVMSQVTPLESPKEGAQWGGIGPYCNKEDGGPKCLIDDEVLQLYLEGYSHASDFEGQIQEVVLEAVRRW